MDVSLYRIAFLIFFITARSAQSEDLTSYPENTEPLDEDDFCQIKETQFQTKFGVCRPITKCPEIKNQIGKADPVHCGFQGLEPLVCCPYRISASLVDNRNSTRLEVKGCGIRPIRLLGSHLKKRAVAIEGRPSVVGGKQAVPYSWPWVAALIVKNKRSGWTFICGASIISERYAITTAHCFDNVLRKKEPVDPTQYAIRVGVHDRDNGTLVTFNNVRVHQNYVPGRSYNDIALLSLTDDLIFTAHIKPVCLPFKELDAVLVDGEYVTVAGWGDTTFSGFDSQVLQEVTIRIVNNSGCGASYSRVASSNFPNGVSDSLLCAGDPVGGKDACQGDSGGPLVYSYGVNRYYLVGLVSFGYGCGFQDFPGIYTRVTSFLPWIEENTPGLL